MMAHGVEQWLADTIGLDARALGRHAVTDAVQGRMAACGLGEEGDYLARLRTTEAEALALIEMVVVPETWFFRDREPFAFLVRHICETWLPAHSHATLRVLSAPCSSGEEPYSIAMALQSVGLLPARYRIDAVDISTELLRKAEKGAYGANSFRGGLPVECERYFKQEDDVRVVPHEIRAGIRFVRGNIMDLPLTIAEQDFDIVFCRNLLIYQRPEAREKIVAALDRLLKPGGLLCVGHAEMMPQLAERYDPVRHSGAFTYQKHEIETADAEPLAEAFKTPVTGNVSGDRRRPAASTAVHSPGELPPDAWIERGRVLADQGRLAEAAAIYRALLKEHPQLAKAHFLLGVIQTAAGQVHAAEECLNRALYLEADYYEALIHLSLLKSRRGDEEGAGLLRRRAERVRGQAVVTK